MADSIYLDYAAATPMDPAVVAVMQPYFSQQFYNPSATYLAAKRVATEMADARAGIAHWLGARPTEIIFTAGGTEANNLAVHGVMQAHPGGNVVTCTIEHESVLRPASHYRHKLVKVLPDGTIDLKKLTKKIDNKTVLVSIMYANNEIGTVEPIAKIGQLLAEIRQKRLANGNRRPLYFHTDACQAANYLDMHVNRLGVDMMTVNGGKIYGPKQSGFLYIKTGTKLKPQILGGGQELGIRSGTENVAAIIGLDKALGLVQARRIQETERVRRLQNLFFKLLVKEIPSVIINGSTTNRLPNNVHITIPGQDNETLMMKLDEQGIICGMGSACSASNEEPSHVLKALGHSDVAAQSSLRFSLGRSTTAADIRRVVAVLKQSQSSLVI